MKSKGGINLYEYFNVEEFIMKMHKSLEISGVRRRNGD